MQLNRTSPGQISRTLGLITANLLAATGAIAQTTGDIRTPGPAGLHSPAATVAAGAADVVNDDGLIRVDTAMLFYSEDKKRVHASEPAINITINRGKNIFTVGLLYDAVSGATPNGAAPWTALQGFHIYTQPANKLPLYPYFSDRRKSQGNLTLRKKLS